MLGQVATQDAHFTLLAIGVTKGIQWHSDGQCATGQEKGLQQAACWFMRISFGVYEGSGRRYLENGDMIQTDLWQEQQSEIFSGIGMENCGIMTESWTCLGRLRHSVQWQQKGCLCRRA